MPFSIAKGRQQPSNDQDTRRSVSGGPVKKDMRSYSERIAARDPDRQTAEIQIRVALINRFNALGTAEIVRVAQHWWRKGHYASRRRSATTPTQTIEVVAKFCGFL
ncbi:hypothetical protein CCR83_11680 [Rhodobacter veldkampii DSM 11550]|nr:hypothetical protein [Phaeovulum veldkampii DSM 11550]